MSGTSQVDMTTLMLVYSLPTAKAPCRGTNLWSGVRGMNRNGRNDGAFHRSIMYLCRGDHPRMVVVSGVQMIEDILGVLFIFGTLFLVSFIGLGLGV